MCLIVVPGVTAWGTGDSPLSGMTEGVVMKASKKVVLHSASAAAVISILVSVVGAGTKWMGN